MRHVVLVAVGHFTILKRLDLLIRAFDDARRRTKRPVAMVLVGGHPGEWQGEHPIEAIDRIGATSIFLAGWHDHNALPEFPNAADEESAFADAIVAAVDYVEERSKRVQRAG